MSDIIYGINPVSELLKAGKSRIRKIIFARERGTKGIIPIVDLAKKSRIPIEYQQKRVLDRTSGTKSHQGVVALVASHREGDIDDIIDIWKNSGETPGNGQDDDGNGFTDDYDGWDFEGSDGDPRSSNGHGTNVAGVVGFGRAAAAARAILDP